MEQFWVIFWGAVGTIATGLVTWLTALLTSFLNSKIKDKKLVQYMTAITEIVMSSVQTVSQTFVDTLKKNGKFDEQAQNEAKERALTIIKSQLTPELTNYITENFGDITNYLTTQIEATIYNLKK